MGKEMAFRGGEGDGDPQFELDGVPCLQIDVLHVELASRLLAIVSQLEAGIGWWRPEAPLEPYHDGIFRVRRLSELPLGVIEAIDVGVTSEGNVSELRVRVDGQELFLISGEAVERTDGTLFFQRDDESLLVFRSRDDINRLAWAGAD